MQLQGPARVYSAGGQGRAGPVLCRCAAAGPAAGSSAEQATEKDCPRCSGLVLGSPALFLALSRGGEAKLCQSLGGVKQVASSGRAPKGGEAGCSHWFLFPARGSLWGWELPLGTGQCQPGGRNDAGKMTLFFLPFLWGSSQAVCSAVLWKLRPSGPPSSPRTVSVGG